jgi:hypothetical protein
MNKISSILILALLAVTPVFGHSQAANHCCPDDASLSSGFELESCSSATLCCLEEAPVTEVRKAQSPRPVSQDADVTFADTEAEVTAPATQLLPAPGIPSGFGSPAIPLVLRR